jgi:hypothetical protein
VAGRREREEGWKNFKLKRKWKHTETHGICSVKVSANFS